MQIKIKYSNSNQYPLSGFLIKGSDLKYWASELTKLQLKLEEVKVYPLPNTSPNSIWGCYVFMHQMRKLENLHKHSYCQVANEFLIIPANSQLYPISTNEEWALLLNHTLSILHPEFGLVELKDEVNWSNFMTTPIHRQLALARAEDSVYIPKHLKNISVKKLPAVSVIEHMLEKINPIDDQKKFKPLEFKEKIQLRFYKFFFKKDKPKNNDHQGYETRPFMNALNKITGMNSNWVNNLKEKYEDLERRNKRQVDKLVDLLNKDPFEGLKYAIPLDPSGIQRGPEQQNPLSFIARWENFSLFNKLGNIISSGGGGSYSLGDEFYRLKQQYNKTAKELIDKGEFKKASFIYLKLLKDYQSAATTLEKGKHFNEAASVYIEYLKDKKQAARCYELANMYTHAIECYKELNDNEKVGDLYFKIKQYEIANQYFEKHVNELINSNRYVKAALLYRQKMNKPEKGQVLLLKGWTEKKDPVNCLNNYLANITNINYVGDEIKRIYREESSISNLNQLLKVLQHEYNRKNELQVQIRNIAYEIISKLAEQNPDIVTDLTNFNEKDDELTKDTIRFKMKNK